MPSTTFPQRPSKKAQGLALDAYNRLKEDLPHLDGEHIMVQIENEKEPLTLPREALILLRDVLSAMAKGRPVAIVPLAMELTTQAAADHLGCSRPHLVQLLESGEIPFTKVGRHRRVCYEDVVKYEKDMRMRQKALLGEMMADDEASGLYKAEDDTQ